MHHVHPTVQLLKRGLESHAPSTTAWWDWRGFCFQPNGTEHRLIHLLETSSESLRPTHLESIVSNSAKLISLHRIRPSDVSVKSASDRGSSGKRGPISYASQSKHLTGQTHEEKAQNSGVEVDRSNAPTEPFMSSFPGCDKSQDLLPTEDGSCHRPRT